MLKQFQSKCFFTSNGSSTELPMCLPFASHCFHCLSPAIFQRIDRWAVYSSPTIILLACLTVCLLPPAASTAYYYSSIE